MQKCINKGAFTCISRHGVPKKRFETDNAAIAAAKIINNLNKDLPTKLVGYKCSHCGGYHLTTHLKRIRK